MKIETILSPTLYPGRQLQTGHATVAVDVLRATTAICAAFKAGAKGIVPLASLEPLAEMHRNGYVVAAERGGKKLNLAECGNSPTEYLSMNLDGKRLAYSTTNGTVSILTALGSEPLLTGAFANITALADCLKKLPDGKGLVILCSGWEGDPSVEDTLFAGALTERLLPDAELVNDSATMALDLWKQAKGDLYGYCQKATHVERLRRLGAEADIRFAMELDSCAVVPRYDYERKMLVRGG